MQQYLNQIKQKVKDSDLVVVGLGEEWNISSDAMESEAYQRISEDLKEHPEYKWILPYVYEKLTDETLKSAYTQLFEMLADKNYFVVATTTNSSFLPYVKGGRAVMPCGSSRFMCEEALTDRETYREFLESLDLYIAGDVSLADIHFVQKESGELLTFNNIYAPGYEEKEYLHHWQEYMSWLQGTMNRNTCLLELGAGLQFPSVFRFPFEKMTYFNRKAFCFRVHKSLYQLTEEMAERSVSVQMHAVDLFAQSEQRILV